MMRAELPGLKAVYTLDELALLSGLSRHQVRWLVLTRGIPTERIGKKRLVILLSTLRAAFPELVDSILESRALRAEMGG